MDIEIVPARSSFQWLGLGFRTFCRRPLAFVLLPILLSFPLAICYLLASPSPVIETVLYNAVLPFHSLMTMIVASQAFSGTTSLPALIVLTLRAFRTHLRALITLGAVHALALCCIVAMVSLVQDRGFALEHLPMALQLSPGGESGPAQVDIIKLLAIVPQVLFGFAPALVYWYSATPGQAIFLSAAAYLRNWRAFLLFGVIRTVLVAGPLLGVMLILAFLPATASAANAALIEGAAGVITIPAVILSISQLFSFRDCFAPRRTWFSSLPRLQCSTNQL
ncbi:MAG: BPSS1780 family membrane protein [Comamonas sp.]|uniref:BPSS1780 family membrane protein n=1 Tax=Comamonas sp. TaxID=34028 RepID=UPI002FC5DC04